MLGTAAALAMSMPATAEPITVHLVLTIQPGIDEPAVTPLFGPLHAGDTLPAVITFDPNQVDFATDPYNGWFKSISGSIGTIPLPFGEMETGTGPTPDISHDFQGSVGGVLPNGGRVWFGFIWQRPLVSSDALPQSARDIAGYGPGLFTFDVVDENDASALNGTVQAVAQTPEPASLLLLGTGAAFLLRRRKQRV
jgi:hypothetical protein